MLGSALLRVRRHEGTVIVAKDEETAMRFFQTKEWEKLSRNAHVPVDLIVESKSLDEYKPVLAIILSEWDAHSANIRGNEHVHRGYSRMYERAQRMKMIDTSTFQQKEEYGFTYRYKSDIIGM
jgi:hypothetical protein